MNMNLKLTATKIGLIIGINSLAVVVALSGLIVFKSPSQTLAATSAYTSTWTVTKCRVLTQQANMSVGPAEWNVVHSLANGKKITEIWTATGWQNDNYAWKDDRIGWAVQPSGPLNENCKKSNKNNIRVSGLYGFFVGDSASGSTVSFGSSTPTGWTVVSTIE